jgi:hypothetical protein
VQILEVWILGTVQVYHQRKVSVMTKFDLRQADGNLCDDASRMNTAVPQNAESLLLSTKLIYAQITNEQMNSMEQSPSEKLTGSQLVK